MNYDDQSNVLKCAKDHPTLPELRQYCWKKKALTGTFPRGRISPDEQGFSIHLNRNEIEFSNNGKWVDETNPEAVPTTTNPIVSENRILRQRVETLTRTAAISEIEVQQLKAEIAEAEQILEQLQNSTRRA